MRSFGRAGPGSRPTCEKSAVHIGTELLLHGTSHTVSGLRATAVRSLIVRPGQDPNRADFKFGKQVVPSVNLAVRIRMYLHNELDICLYLLKKYCSILTFFNVSICKYVSICMYSMYLHVYACICMYIQ